MIIGAGGSLGRVLCDLFVENKYNVIAIDKDENSIAYLYRVCNLPRKNIYIEDICNFDMLKRIIEYHKIDIVVNCAALKHVLWCEYNIKHAIDVNIFANLEIINYLKKEKKKFIFISSDKAINPTNVYALTKQFTDYITSLYNFKIVRGVNLLNSKGSVLNIWDEQKEKKVFTVIDNEKCARYFMFLSQMADIVKTAVESKDFIVEYTPQVVYKIYIYDLFKAYLKMNNILNYKVKNISLCDNEKIIEDLNFKAKIKEIRDVDKIVSLLEENK